MNMKRITLFIFLQILLFNSYAQFSVSPNKHFILRDGKPFTWLGDTGWELLQRLNRQEADYYLVRRAEQGFTVIQTVVLAEFDGLHIPNANGDLPLNFDDPTMPNEKYFEQVDYIIDKAASVGLTIALLPTWGDKVYKDGWGKGPEIFTPANARVYGKWIGDRYKNKKNIIWIMGGDRNPRAATNDVEIWRAMAAGVEEGVGGQDKALMSFHPQGVAEGGSQWFHNDSWFDFNMLQTGHCTDQPVYDKILASYNRLPTKPVLDGEPIYENIPICFDEKDMGKSSAYDVRKAAYNSLFAGAFGHTYGCNDIWQMHTPAYEAVLTSNLFYKEAMELNGANQMKFVRRLLESRPFLDRVPDQSMVVENNLFADERIQATHGKDYAFIYTAQGRAITVNMGKISGTKITASWYNPRNGVSKEAGSFDNKGQQKFTAPTAGYGQDWVLILDDESKHYAKP
jgi:hypothetical protein